MSALGEAITKFQAAIVAGVDRTVAVRTLKDEVLQRCAVPDGDCFDVTWQVITQCRIFLGEVTCEISPYITTDDGEIRKSSLNLNDRFLYTIELIRQYDRTPPEELDGKSFLEWAEGRPASSTLQ